MDEFKVIAVMNEAMIMTLRDNNENYENNLKIRENLKDETFFFRIDKSQAYEVLKSVGIQQRQLESVYKKLTSENVFYGLLHRGKLNANDEGLIVKYEPYRT